jgi:hypothetical protein
MIRKPHRSILGVLALAMATLAGGCISETTTSSLGRMPAPEIRKIAPPPKTARVNDIAILKSMRPIDTDATGFPNRMEITLYLFSRPYPVPLWARGTMKFKLYAPGSFDFVNGEIDPPLAEWTFTSDQLQPLRFKDVVGEGYGIVLDLNAVGISRLPVKSANLVSEFVPVDGSDPVKVRSVQSVLYME